MGPDSRDWIADKLKESVRTALYGILFTSKASRQQCQNRSPTPYMPMISQFGIITSDSTSIATEQIQDTMNKVKDWTNKWAFKINITKTVSILFLLSTSKEQVKLTLGEKTVPQVDTATFLGATRLTWKPHLEAVEARTTKKLSHMKKQVGNHRVSGGKYLTSRNEM